MLQDLYLLNCKKDTEFKNIQLGKTKPTADRGKFFSSNGKIFPLEEKNFYLIDVNSKFLVDRGF